MKHLLAPFFLLLAAAITGAPSSTTTNVPITITHAGVSGGTLSSTGAASTNGASVTTPAINTTGTNLILVAVSAGAALPDTVLSDGAGNSWTGTALVTGIDANGRTTTIFGKFNPTTSASHTITVTTNGNAPIVNVLAVGGGPTPTVDLTRSSPVSGSSVSSIQPGSLTPSAPNELLFTSLVLTASGATGISVDSGFTPINLFPGKAGRSYAGGAAYLIQTTATSENPTWGWSGPLPAATVMVAIKGSFAVGGGGSNITAINATNSSFSAQPGNAGLPIATLSASTERGQFGGNFKIGTAPGCVGANNNLFATSGTNGTTLGVGAADVQTPGNYTVSVLATDPTFGNSPKCGLLTLTGSSVANCACGAGGSPNMCLDQASVKAGTPVNVTLVCGPANGAFINWKIWGWGTFENSVPVSGQSTTTVQMTPPDFSLFSPLPLSLYVADVNESEIANNDQHPVTLQPNVTRTLAAGLPASEPDPFVPQHTVTVCPSGCDYAHPEDAIIFVNSQTTWDNVLITIEVAEYVCQDGASNNCLFFNNPNMPNHVWVKGIIGNSGTDGTVFPHIWGGTTSGSSMLSTSADTGMEKKDITIDNFDIGPTSSGQLSYHGIGTLRLRNVYMHDAYYLLITNDFTPGTHTEIYNSHFARGHSHDIYIGAENGTGSLIIKNSVAEQANSGHDVKSRAAYTELDCNELIIDQDPIYAGSELTDCSEGRECHVHNNLYVTANGKGDSWVNNQGYDSIRFGADREFPMLPNNILDVTGNTFVVDSGGNGHRMLNLYAGLTPSPPYLVDGNTFVYKNSSMATKNNPTMNPVFFGDFNTDVSAIIAIGNPTKYAPQGTAMELTYGAGNHVFQDRASAGFPAALPQFAPVPFNDPSISPLRPAACTDPVGNVMVPAH